MANAQIYDVGHLIQVNETAYITDIKNMLSSRKLFFYSKIENYITTTHNT